MSDRVTQLEELLARQQRMLDELNDVVIDLRSELDRTTAEQTRLKRTVQRLVEHYESADGAPDEKPPHY